MTSPTLFPAQRKMKESEIELTIRRLFTAAGLVVYKASQGYRKERGGTRMTPGIPDLWWFSPALQTGGWFEVKTPEGMRDHYKLLRTPAEEVAPSREADYRRARAQKAFREQCARCGVRYGFGGTDDARAFLVELGLAEWRGSVFTLTPGKPTQRQAMLKAYEESEAIGIIPAQQFRQAQLARNGLDPEDTMTQLSTPKESTP